MLQKIIFLCICIIPIYAIISVITYFSDGSGGVGVSYLASEIFEKYDQDGDGLIDVRSETILQTTMGDDKNVIKIESRGKLFFDADSLGMMDGKVNKKELYDLISQYDEDNDSEIVACASLFFECKGEDEKFSEKYGERFGYHKKD
jgi:Ca2+-binding EF-hand superfamily protein